MNKKKLTGIIVLVAVIIIVIVAAVWIGAKTAKAPEMTSSVVSSTGAAVSTTSSSGEMSVTIKPFYGNGSFSFNYPTSWSISSYSPFAMTTFDGKYVDGDLIPEGGAEIDVVTTTVYGNLQSIMTTELMSATNVATSAVSIDDVPCAKTTYDNSYTPNIASKDTAIYCQQGSELWKIYLSYRADDANASTHVADLNSILQSMKLLP